MDDDKITTKMDPAVKARWVAALRSGDYPQAAKRLFDGKGYCCLGVLCDLHDPALWLDADGDGDHTYLDREATLPRQVVTWAGLKSINPQLSSYPGDDLITINDSGSDFQEIAELIEAKL